MLFAIPTTTSNYTAPTKIGLWCVYKAHIRTKFNRPSTRLIASAVNCLFIVIFYLNWASINNRSQWMEINNGCSTNRVQRFVFIFYLGIYARWACVCVSCLHIKYVYVILRPNVCIHIRHIVVTSIKQTKKKQNKIDYNNNKKQWQNQMRYADVTEKNILDFTTNDCKMQCFTIYVE